jgi:hypothetical protein
VDWGVGQLERDVIKPIDIRNGSGVLLLSMDGQNGCILFAILDQFLLRESFLLSSIRFGPF